MVFKFSEDMRGVVFGIQVDDENIGRDGCCHNESSTVGCEDEA